MSNDFRCVAIKSILSIAISDYGNGEPSPWARTVMLDSARKSILLTCSICNRGKSCERICFAVVVGSNNKCTSLTAHRWFATLGALDWFLIGCHFSYFLQVYIGGPVPFRQSCSSVGRKLISSLIGTVGHSLRRPERVRSTQDHRRCPNTSDWGARWAVTRRVELAVGSSLGEQGATTSA